MNDATGQDSHDQEGDLADNEGDRPPLSPEAQALLRERAKSSREVTEGRRKRVPRTEGFEVPEGIRSRERVRDLAEVFTSEREVRAMLELLNESTFQPGRRFLEPTCGNGNFLEEIIARKIEVASPAVKTQDDFEFLVLRSVADCYGIDIDEENASQARERVHSLCRQAYSSFRQPWEPRKDFERSLRYILSTNVVVGDFLADNDQLTLIEYSIPSPHHFVQRQFLLGDTLPGVGLFAGSPTPLKVSEATHFLELGGFDD